MMLRKLAVSLAVAGIISASNANALGLGEIKINSALNEPLNAEIQLLQVRKLSPLQIQPRMADIDEFALAGLDKSRFLTDVSFQVKVNPDGTGTITLRSDRPVREPFLNFLVELNWPNGRLVREYTLLLDPPVFDPTPVRKTVQPASVAPQVQSTPVASTPKPAAPVSNIRTRVDGKKQVYVDVRDTLWDIALKHRPSRSVPVKKMMIALQNKNPDAFINNNINALRAGVVLNLPTAEEIEQLNNKNVDQEYQRQTSEWKNRGKSTPAPLEVSKKKSVTEAVETEPAPAPQDPKEVELKIVTPKETIEPEDGVATDQSDSAAEPDQSAEPKAEMAASAAVDSSADPDKQMLAQRNQELEDRLSQSLENADKISRENAELNERLDGIQYELEKLREMLELKDKELAALQNQAAAKAAAPVAPAPAPEKGLVDKIMDSPSLLGGIGAGVIALLAGLLFLMRRRNNDEGEQKSDESALVQMPEDLKEPADAAVAAAVAESVEEVSSEPEAAEDLDISAEEGLLDDAELNADDSTDEISDLDDLDLDMDLDLEEESSSDVLQVVESNTEPDELDALLNDDEFDLGLDEEIEVDAETAEDDSLDAILGEVDEPDALDDILGETEEDITSELDDILADVENDMSGEMDLDFEVAATDTAERADLDQNDDDDALDFIMGDDSSLLEVAEDDASESDSTELDMSADLDDILGDFETGLEVNDETAVAEDLSEQTSDIAEANDDLEAIMAGDQSLSMDVDEDEMDAGLEAMLAANPDPGGVLPGKLEEQTFDEEIETPEELESLLAQVDEDIDMSFNAANDEAEAAEEQAPEVASDAAGDDLDAMLDDIGLDLDEGLTLEEPEISSVHENAAATEVEEIVLQDADLESAIENDLNADLDAELDALLNNDADGIELEESGADEDFSMDEDFDELAGLNLLEGADEVETKLDLARAYMDMEDLDGAKDILQEIVAEGSDEQKQEAEALIRSIDEK